MPQRKNRLGLPQNPSENVFRPSWKARYQAIPDDRDHADENIIREEPMVFSATPDFAYQNGGPITRDLIIGLTAHLQDQTGTPLNVDWSIDTRVHMLMPGMYPAIPGWHLDAIRRPDGMEGTPGYQPMWWDRPCQDRHFMCVIGESAMPRFLKNDVYLDTPTERLVYSDFNKQITAKMDGYGEPTAEVTSGTMYEFGSSDLHEAQPNYLDKPIWRFFFRASNAEFVQRNEIRNQVQVYTTDGGW